jgi:hypothetical protein
VEDEDSSNDDSEDEERRGDRSERTQEGRRTSVQQRRRRIEIDGIDDFAQKRDSWMILRRRWQRPSRQIVVGVAAEEVEHEGASLAEEGVSDVRYGHRGEDGDDELPASRLPGKRNGGAAVAAVGGWFGSHGGTGGCSGRGRCVAVLTDGVVWNARRRHV